MHQPLTNEAASIGEIAIIGMNCRFPGARSVLEFWKNLRAGLETIDFFSREELIASGIAPELLDNPAYVPAKGVIADLDLFDAPFFDYSPREAELLDPQQRLFLECAWESLELAGYDPKGCPGLVGVFAGIGLNSYLVQNLYHSGKLGDGAGAFQAVISNDKDFLASRVCYKLNLKGPGITVQTACSTSLVAVHLACQSLLNGECDMALAGGVSLRLPQKGGYLYQEGMILSPDGHCRPFDARAQGTVAGDGVGIVVLKRLEESLKDGDHVHAVIKGSSVNNDGALKAGYTAPGVEGQKGVILDALAVSGISPETVSYVETHGTGTPLGDPIEVAALTQAFRSTTDRVGYCALGSVKSNLGHLDTAAGIAGLIKTALALEHGEIPPTLHFETPNPQIDFASTPFFVVSKLSRWEPEGVRRAGVSSFGIGGTNAHVVLEEPPVKEPLRGEKILPILPVAARSDDALAASAASLAEHLRSHPKLELSDVAFTLAVGRHHFSRRRALVCSDTAHAITLLESVSSGKVAEARRPIVFLCSGQGAQEIGMCSGIYRHEPVFRETIDHCTELLRPRLGFDLKEVLYPEVERREEAARKLLQTEVAQPALFAVEFALAKLWISCGVQPEALLGHSLGEYVAASLAGIFTFEEGLELVAFRGSLMQKLPSGTMMALSLSREELLPILPAGVSLAAENLPTLSVVSGPHEALGELEKRLANQGINRWRLATSHAFHSAMMDPILDEFRAFLERLTLKAPTIPILSNLTGSWLTASEATDPEYWVTHLRQTVLFSEGLSALFEIPERVFLEIGPGRTLAGLAQRHPEKPAQTLVLSSTPHSSDRRDDLEHFRNTQGALWEVGAPFDWNAYYQEKECRRVPLPCYPFERRRYWIEGDTQPHRDKPLLEKKSSPSDWLYLPTWTRGYAPQLPQTEQPQEILCFADPLGFADTLAAKLRLRGHQLILVRPGTGFSLDGVECYLERERPEQYQLLLDALVQKGRFPQTILHCWCLTGDESWEAPGMPLGFLSLLYLAQALGPLAGKSLTLLVTSDRLHRVNGSDPLDPGKSLLTGPLRVIPQEYPWISCRSIDLVEPADGCWGGNAELVLAELLSPSKEPFVAYRGGFPWLQRFELSKELAPSDAFPRLKTGGVYLITGGLGGIGLALARHVAQRVQPKLVLVGRSQLPDSSLWDREAVGDDPAAAKIRALREIESLGAQVLVLSADVCDRERMTEVVREARQCFGRIDGVIHAAGVPGDGVIQLKTLSMVERVLAPKVQGTLVLEELLGHDLDFLVLCSSINGVTGGFGQVDYAAANAFLDAFALKRSCAGNFTLSIAWDAWREVGMAAEALRRRIPGHGEPMAHPLLGYRLAESPQKLAFIVTLSFNEHWVLNQHLVLGMGAVPGTTYLEMVRAALQPEAEELEFNEVYFQTLFTVAAGEERSLLLTLTGSVAEGYHFSVASGEGQSQVEHARGRVALVPVSLEKRLDLEAIRKRCGERRMIRSEEEWERREGFVEVGPRWNNLRQVDIGNGEGLALLEIPESFAGDLEIYGLHPALMDTSVGLAVLEHEGFFLPFSYKKIRVHGRLQRRIYSHLRYRDKERGASQSIAVDVTLTDTDGRVLVEIEEYSLRRIQGTPEQRAREPEPVPRKSAEPDPLAYALTPTEGMALFEQLLCGNLPHVVVSTLDFQTRRTLAHHIPGSSHLKQVHLFRKPSKHPRPQVSTPYLEPKSELERQVAEIWQEFLGLDQVGINDNFMELGGDSLLATQVISEVREALGMDLPLAAVFDEPTVAGLVMLAEAIRERQPEEGAPDFEEGAL